MLSLSGNWGDEGSFSGPARGGGARPGTSFGGRPGSSSGRFRGDSGADGQAMVDKFDGSFGQDAAGRGSPDIPRLEEVCALLLLTHRSPRRGADVLASSERVWYGCGTSAKRSRQSRSDLQGIGWGLDAPSRFCHFGGHW